MMSSSGRMLKLTKEGNLAWYKTGAATGVPEAAEGGGVEDGVFSISLVKRIERGYKTTVFATTGEEGKSCFCFSIITSERTLDLEAESEEVRNEWCNALEKHLQHGLAMEDIELGGDLSVVMTPDEKRAKRQEERDKAYNKHSADREKLRRARTSSQQRASTYNK
ncbi:hypothetical protein TL16_g05253, partial [Triparma laevis f. inornata]